eukprot:CAMPEP_0119311254 /NCGR_PEP_ID=MMETSP1333-20130426/22005_1 /TAXON_ID=418940 /ORGANISM="Scyphosphaera apsteinii, Strain RCC1455" /LENGTH=283 /DNA_ID=CAMNT_0007315595 /DNA_START=167 /DNA_END=1018 /DNA_ORIENTATION=+
MQLPELDVQLPDLDVDLLLHILRFAEALCDVLAFCNSNRVTGRALNLLKAWPSGKLSALGHQAFSAALLADRLCMINLSGNMIGPNCVTAITDTLRASTCLTSLNVSNNNIKGRGVMFGDALKANSSLKELNMTGCRLDTKDGKGLAGGLAVHASLTSLNVSFNDISGSGEPFGEALKANSSLTELVMRGCRLNAEDAKDVAIGLAGSTSLTQLDLSENQLCGLNIWGRGTYDATGIKAIGVALAVNASLTSLDVRYNNCLGDKAKVTIREAVKNKVRFDLKV